jgi:hypothetical protein
MKTSQRSMENLWFSQKTVEYFQKNRKWIVTIIVIGGLFLLWIIGYIHFRLMDFNGTVQNVTYSVKGFPTVTINGTNYSLDYTNWGFNVPIEKRDKLIKKKGEMNLKLTKRNRKDTIDFLMKW